MMVKISSKDVAFLNKLLGSMQMPNYTYKIAGRYNPLGMYPRTEFGYKITDNLLSTALNTAGILGLGGMAAGAVSQIYNAVKDKVKSHNAYKEMFNEFPELKDADRKQVDKYWTVLRDYSPELTQNPLVAGQFVSNMMQYGMRGIDHNTIGQLASIHNDLNRDSSNNMNMLGNVAGNLIREDYKGMIQG